MNWKSIARHEASLAAGSRAMKYVLGLLVAVVLLTAYVYPVFGDDPSTTARFTGYVSGSLTTLVPFAGIMLGYGAVAGDRESGALRLSLSFPRSRRELVLGKYLGRSGVLAAAIVAAMAVAAVLVVYPFGELEALPFLAFVALTVAFGGIWTGLGVAVSASVATERRALVLGFGLFALFTIAWGPAQDLLQLGLHSAGLIEGDLPEPLQFLFALSPGEAFERITAGFLDPSESVDGPWYHGEWVALVIFAFWAVGPLGLAIRRFEGSDLS